MSREEEGVRLGAEIEKEGVEAMLVSENSVEGIEEVGKGVGAELNPSLLCPFRFTLFLFDCTKVYSSEPLKTVVGRGEGEEETANLVGLTK